MFVPWKPHSDLIGVEPGQHCGLVVSTVCSQQDCPEFEPRPFCTTAGGSWVWYQLERPAAWRLQVLPESAWVQWKLSQNVIPVMNWWFVQGEHPPAQRQTLQRISGYGDVCGWLIQVGFSCVHSPNLCTVSNTVAAKLSDLTWTMLIFKVLYVKFVHQWQ